MNDLVVIVEGGVGNWDPAAWQRRFALGLPDRKVVIDGRDTFDPSGIAYAAVWKPPKGALTAFPGLKVVFNLGAGVDAVMGDTTLPAVPLVRVVHDDLTSRMTEYVLLHVLMLHRQQRMLDAAQARAEWVAPDQWAAPALRVGVMGLGEIGMRAAEMLRLVGFDVAGWSRAPKEAAFPTYAGAAGLAPFLARTDVLVVLLPLTPETRGILNRDVLAGLARDGVLGGPCVINAGRGGLQVEADLLAALDDGTLHHAVLDVFTTEPLPAASRFWRHPRVTLTPHNAADSDPTAISAAVAAQIRAFERGEGLQHVVDRGRGY